MISAKPIINKNVHDFSDFKPVTCECGSHDFVFDDKRFETICKHCGLVILESRIDLSSDVRVFSMSPDENPSRIGAPLTSSLHDFGLSTEIGLDKFSGSNEKKAQFVRIRKEHNKSRIKNSKDRNLVQALNKLNLYVSALGISSDYARDVKENASSIYRKALSKNLIQGRSIDGIMASCLFITCRQYHTPRTLNEISNVTGVEKSALSKYNKLLTKELGIKLVPSLPKDFIPRIRTALDVPPEVESKVIDLLNEIQENNFNGGNNPVGIAAALFYIACDECGMKKSQRAVSQASNISEVTIRNISKTLKQYMVA